MFPLGDLAIIQNNLPLFSNLLRDKILSSQQSGGNWNLLRYLFERKFSYSEFFENFMKFIKPFAKQGLSIFPYIFGICCEFGIGFASNSGKAVKYYSKRLKCNESNSIIALSICFLDGKGTEQNFDKALQLVKRAIELGNPYAMNNYAYILQEGIGVQPNLTMSIKYYKKSMKAGNASAMNSLGLYFENGIGVEKDIEKACQLYYKASEFGNYIAIQNYRNILHVISLK
jgi:TPR repeat protein